MNEEGNTLNVSMPEESKKNKKSKTKFIVGGLVVLVAIAVGLWFGFKELGDSKKSKATVNIAKDPVGFYENEINSAYEMLSNSLKQLKETGFSFENMDEPMNVHMDAKFTTNMSELKAFNNMNFGLDVGFDLKNNKMVTGFDLKKDSTTLDVLVAILNNRCYLKSDAILDKPLMLGTLDDLDIDFSDFKELENIKFNADDIDYLLKSYKDVLINFLDEDDFEVDDAKVDGKDVKKVVYELTEKKAVSLIKSIADKSLNDDKILSIIANITDESKSTIKSAFEDMKEMEASNSTETLEIIAYADKDGNIVKGNLDFDGETLATFTDINNEFALTVDADGEKFTLKASENKVVIDYSEGSTNILSLEVSGNNENATMKMTVNESGTKVDMTLELKNVKEETNKMSADFKLSLDATIEGQKINFGLDGKYELNKKAVQSFDTSNAVSENTITQADSEKMLTNLMKVLQDLGLEDLMSGMM